MNFLKNIFSRKRFFKLNDYEFNLRDVKSIKPVFSKTRPALEVQVGDIVHSVYYPSVDDMVSYYSKLSTEINKLWY